MAKVGARLAILIRIRREGPCVGRIFKPSGPTRTAGVAG
jgi:hypothetical protein